MPIPNDEMTPDRADALMIMNNMGLLDFDIALDMAMGDIPLDVDMIKAIIATTDHPPYLEQRFNFV